jgi:hypothetical protein
VNHIWEEVQAKINAWWNDQQQKLEDWVDQRWMSLQESIKMQIDECLQEATKLTENIIERWLQQLCGGAMLPVGAVYEWSALDDA